MVSRARGKEESPSSRLPLFRLSTYRRGSKPIALSRINVLFLLNNFFLFGDNVAVFNATMSFGFSVGDFVVAIELATRIRKEFVGAPGQFKDISDE